jgi:hypothetical protein
LIIPFGADASENGRARMAIWGRVFQLWTDDMHSDGGFHYVYDGNTVVSADPRTLIVASDPWFGQPTPEQPPGARAGDYYRMHPFSVARAINRAVRLAPPEVDSFVCVGADALPDWRVVDWAAEQLETRPWTLLFSKGGTIPADATTWHEADVHEHQTPTVGPIAFTREAFMAVRGFDERFEGWAYEDVDFWSRLRTHPATRQVIEARTSPYPLLQFEHPVDHHDGTEANPNIRLWRAKCSAMPLPDGSRDNDHPATQLFSLDYTGQAS